VDELWRGKHYNIITIIIEERIPDTNFGKFRADQIQGVVRCQWQLAQQEQSHAKKDFLAAPRGISR